MKDLLENLKQRLTEEGTKRVIKFMVIPFVVIILVLAIAIADRSDKNNTQPDASSEESEIASEIAEEPDPVWVLEEETVPEIHSLLNLYLRSRRTSDISGLSEVYGGTYSSEELQNQKAEMEEEVKFYQRFDDLTCFTVPGLVEGEYVVYARYNIKFRQAETTAPSLMVCYAKTAEDGSVYLEANLSSAEKTLLDKVNQSPDVQTMAKEVNEALRSALESDDNLLSVYHLMMEGDQEENQEGSSEGDGPVIIAPSDSSETVSESETESQSETTPETEEEEQAS